MANEIQAQTTTAWTLYALVRNSVGQVWQTTTSTFVTYVTANYANYTIAMTEQGTASGFYAGDFPAVGVDGTYSVVALRRLGGSNAETDTPVAMGNIWRLNGVIMGVAPIPSAIATAVWQDATAGDFTVASSIGKALYIANVVPGAAGGHFIAGSNAATTVNITGNLSGSVGSVTGAVGSVTGAVGSVTGAVGSVTGNVGGDITGKVLGGGASAFTAVGVQADLQTIKTQAVTCAAGVTIRADVGAAAAPGAANGMLIGGSNAATTFAGLTTGALSCTTLTTSGTTTLNAMVVQNSLTVSGSTTLSGPVNASNLANDIRGVAVTDKTGFSLVAAYDPAKTAAQAATALSIVDWTNARAANLDNLDATVSSRSTYAGGDTPGTATLLTRVTGAVCLSGVAPGWYSAPVDVTAIVTAIKAKTDLLTFTVGAFVDCNIQYVNDIEIDGVGSDANPWGPV